jgi:hypothetical protein
MEVNRKKNIMRKLLASLAFVFGMASSSEAALSWDAPAVDLSDFGIQAGWLVFMYRDVDNNSANLNQIIFDNTGAVVSGSGSSPVDDIWTGFQTVTVDIEPPDNLIQFNDQVLPGWESTFGGAWVYTVVINSDSWATATQSRVLDATTIQLGFTDPFTYTVSEPANDWQTVIPEPGTMALLAMGMLAVGMWRRKVIA